METPSTSPVSVGEHFRMIDVGAKEATARTAWAEGRIFVGPLAYELLSERRLPKGDALILAEIAGVMAAKNTALMIPLCHPLPIESARLSCKLEDSTHSVLVTSEVRTTAKTGVEMEALLAVQAALLTIYDLCKGTDPALKIGDLLLLRKEGGKSGVWVHPERQTESAEKGKSEGGRAVEKKPRLEGLRVAVVTISDSCYEGLADDLSGRWLADALEAEGAWLGQQFLVPDEIDSIRQVVSEAAERLSADLIICTGGTGLSPRDLTPEALKGLWEKEIPGFGELLRSSGQQHTPHAYLSRSAAGVLGHSMVIALPGSLKAVQEGLGALLPILPHALHTLRGGKNHPRSSS